jgi:hypothetical protein
VRVRAVLRQRRLLVPHLPRLALFYTCLSFHGPSGLPLCLPPSVRVGLYLPPLSPASGCRLWQPRAFSCCPVRRQPPLHGRPHRTRGAGTEGVVAERAEASAQVEHAAAGHLVGHGGAT